MLRCADGSYYVGITNCVERPFDSLRSLRTGSVDEHQGGYVAEHYTFVRRPVELIYVAAFADVNDAIGWEKRIKGWSRAKKEALIAGDWAAIQ